MTTLTPNYSAMTNSMAARAYAHQEGLAVNYEDAREAFCNQYVVGQLLAITRNPLAESDIKSDMSIWHRFSERQFGNDRLNVAMCRMLAYMANVDDTHIDYLRTVSSELADVALLVRDDVSDMLHEEASGHVDGEGEI